MQLEVTPTAAHPAYARGPLPLRRAHGAHETAPSHLHWGHAVSHRPIESEDTRWSCCATRTAPTSIGEIVTRLQQLDICPV